MVRLIYGSLGVKGLMLWVVRRERVNVRADGSFSVSFLVTAKDFTFSEPCTVIHIHEKDQQDAHFSSLIYSD